MHESQQVRLNIGYFIYINHHFEYDDDSDYDGDIMAVLLRRFSDD